MPLMPELVHELLEGLKMTLEILAISIPIGMGFAIIIASARVYGNKIVSLLAHAYVFVFRGLPLVVTLLLTYFGLGQVGLRLSSFYAATLSFILCTSAYQSEYIRGALRSVSREQSFAARSLGMGKLKELIYIVLPQAYRRALPGVSNEVIYLIKYSSLAYVAGASDLFSHAKSLNALYLQPIVIFTAAGLIYLAMTTVAYFLFDWWERKLKIPGVGMG